jgi:hypothetical protein
MEQNLFVYQRRVTTIKRAKFASDRVSYIVLRGRWCDITVLNVLAPSEDKRNDSKYSLYE